MVWTFHHVLLDGWSVFQVLTDVFAAHQAAGFRGPAVPAGRPPFAGYLGWLAGQDHDAAAGYWAGRLAGFGTPTPLPYDRAPRDTHRTQSADWHSVTVDAGQAERLASYARRHHLTLSTLLEGAWALLLSRYAGQADVVFGTTVSGRPADLPGSDAMTGIFINTLPVRARVDHQAGVTEWLAAHQDDQAEARRYDYLPLTDIQARADIPAGADLFASLVVFENYPINDDAARDHQLALRDLDGRETTSYPLTVVATAGQQMTLDLGYDPAVFSRATIERITAHLRHTLDAIAGSDPDARLASIDVLPPAERDHALEAGHGGPALASPATLAALFEARAATTPDAPAIVTAGGGPVLSYADLDAAAARLAGVLAGRGAGPETVVALALGRSAEIVTAQLAVAKAGAAYLPVDPGYPADRIAFMLTDAAPVLTITTVEHAPAVQAALATRPAAGGGTGADQAGAPGTVPAGAPASLAVLVLDDPGVAAEIAAQPAVAPDGAATADVDHPAYVIYTSGSTGVPKGVAVTGRGLAAFAAAEAAHYQAGPGDRVLMFSSPSFDASVLELCMALPSGAALVVPPPGPLVGDELAAVLEDEGITHALITPAALATVPAATAAHGAAAFRTVIVGGDACTPELVRAWAPGRRMINSYGPTESTVVTSWSRPLSPGEAAPTIGRPIPGTTRVPAR